ncbi:MAG: acetyl-CoA carboxylase biotin carboxylase subunit [Flavobacteriales bacterium]|nr:acetyl-CoA carboxylase biotin carboxylase subunit [Flavobacteriales bacterium]
MKKILIANRGEIALRIMRTCREMGISTVAVFSEADRDSPHVSYADEAVCIGPPPSSQSYLKGEDILKICKERNVDGIHPGYGFLSENDKFAQAAEAAGVIFIGPSSQAIRTMGSKLAAKEAVAAYDIPMIPGSKGAVTDVKEATKIAQEIGYPILIKASAGGGGKGMRVVMKEEELKEQMNLAVSEATSAFGDGSVFIEKYVTSPKHIEIQVLADNHGNVVYLFERECSIQRRHQKVIEEAPSIAIDEATRKAMGEAAVNVAKACDYSGAGTVEFILDEQKNFYFLEMNTRLQVEHPVTEMITGIDLVREQIRVAMNEPLSIGQDDLKINGHAIEVRVYAEDPANKFLPDIGTLHVYQKPSGPGVRVDDGFEQGMTIPIYYDPMISKLIVHARNRDEAIGRMLRAIADYRVVGVATTLPFCAFVLSHEAFVTGAFDTHFVANYFTPEKLRNDIPQDHLEVGAIMAAFVRERDKQQAVDVRPDVAAPSRWKANRMGRS